MATSLVSRLQRLLRRLGAHGDVWQARERLASTLDAVPDAQRLAFGDVLAEIDALLATELPRLDAEARFLRRWLAGVDESDLRDEVRRWERALYAADDAELREVRERNLALAQSHLDRVRRLRSALERYQDRVRGLALAITEVAGRIAAARLEGRPALEPELQRLRADIDSLADELAELGRTL